MDEALLAHLQTFLTDRRRKLFKEILEKRTRHFTVATEDVYQLHNTSAVMRSCEVFGIQDIHVVEESVGKQIDKEIAMGAQKWVNLHRYDSVQDSINSLRGQGYKIIATTPHTNATLLHDFDVSHKSAFFFGKERDGLSDIVMEQADGFLKIPMYGFTESLNLSVSAAITLQSVVTKLKQTEIPWQLSETEKKELELDWTKKTIKSIDEIIERYYEQKKHHSNRG